MLQLNKGARPDEKFHLQTGPPVPHVMNLWIMKRVTWSNLFLDPKEYPPNTPGEFVSWWFLGNAIHYYKGNVKCDATRCHLYWDKKLDDGIGEEYVPDPNEYVMTTTEKEKFSVRFFVDPGEPNWDNMGSS